GLCARPVPGLCARPVPGLRAEPVGSLRTGPRAVVEAAEVLPRGRTSRGCVAELLPRRGIAVGDTAAMRCIMPPGIPGKIRRAAGVDVAAVDVVVDVVVDVDAA